MSYPSNSRRFEEGFKYEDAFYHIIIGYKKISICIKVDAMCFTKIYLVLKRC